MPLRTEWKVRRPRSRGPRITATISIPTCPSVVGLHSIIPPDAFTADTFGVERAGNGVLIGSGLVLTIGYLMTEVIGVAFGDGRVVEGRCAASTRRPVSAAGARQARRAAAAARLIERRAGRRARGGWRGRRRSRRLAARIAAKQEFAGYWEYVLDEAIFTFPAHPNWGGTALISPKGELIGIGSLQLERARDGKSEHLNMVVPNLGAKSVIEAADGLAGLEQIRLCDPDVMLLDWDMPVLKGSAWKSCASCARPGCSRVPICRSSC